MLYSSEQIFFKQNGYNQDAVIREFINDFASKYPYIDVRSVPTETIKEFMYQPYVIKGGIEWSIYKAVSGKTDYTLSHFRRDFVEI